MSQKTLFFWIIIVSLKVIIHCVFNHNLWLKPLNEIQVEKIQNGVFFTLRRDSSSNFTWKKSHVSNLIISQEWVLYSFSHPTAFNFDYIGTWHILICGTFSWAFQLFQTYGVFVHIASKLNKNLNLSRIHLKKEIWCEHHKMNHQLF